MIELWVPVTIVAALLQNIRSTLQKRMTATLSTGGAAYCRFIYGVPFALLYIAGLGLFFPLPELNWTFAGFVLLGGTAQIVATFLLVASFSYRNFAVATAFAMTETVQVALFGLLILGDTLPLAAMVGILVSLVGVLALTVQAGTRFVSGLASPAAALGIGAGAGFAIAAVSYRAASLSLGAEGFILPAATTLAAVLVYQTLAMGLYLVFFERGEITRVAGAWRSAIWIGAAGMAASACWFVGFTLETAAYVRALGQVELVFTFLASIFIFREKSTVREVVGVLMVVTGILVLLLA